MRWCKGKHIILVSVVVLVSLLSIKQYMKLGNLKRSLFFTVPEPWKSKVKKAQLVRGPSTETWDGAGELQVRGLSLLAQVSLPLRKLPVSLP